MSNATPRTTATAAKNLRAHINALSLDLAHCSTAAETRCVKQAIRAAEFELTAMGTAGVVAGTRESNAFLGASRAWFVRKTVFGGLLGSL